MRVRSAKAATTATAAARTAETLKARVRAADGPSRDPSRPVYVISVAAELVSVHPRTLRIYEVEGLLCPARTRTNIRLYSENDIRRVLWIRHLTQNLGVNLAGVRVLFELEERLGMRILETLYRDRHNNDDPQPEAHAAAGHSQEKE
jgi:MerR family transcriptional regulator, heat shock protein HspR